MANSMELLLVPTKTTTQVSRKANPSNTWSTTMVWKWKSSPNQKWKQSTQIQWLSSKWKISITGGLDSMKSWILISWSSKVSRWWQLQTTCKPLLKEITCSIIMLNTRSNRCIMSGGISSKSWKIDLQKLRGKWLKRLIGKIIFI